MALRGKKYTNIYGEPEFENRRYENEDSPWDNWKHMPHYDPKDACDAYMTLEVEFADDNAMTDFANLIGQSINQKTKSTWFPARFINRYKGSRYICDYYKTGEYKPENYPKYPIYIVSKTRWEIRPTSDSLVDLGIKHFIVVEQSQYQEYFSRVDPKWVTVLILPQKYLDDYDTCDDLRATRSKCPGAARNFAWDHSISLGFKRHWVMDDNQRGFYRHDGDKRTPTWSGAFWRAMEDHTDQYENVYMSGPHYRFFVVPGNNVPPFVPNCRIYSCNLILNDIPYRWRGRYNEDTDLSLRILKDGWCTIQYNAFTTGKMVTQALAGGNTTEFYAKEGTKPKSQMIEDLHPDVAQVKWMNNRWHHWVDYAPFRSNKLIPVENPHYNPDPEYGMELADVTLKEENQDDE